MRSVFFQKKNVILSKKKKLLSNFSRYLTKQTLFYSLQRKEKDFFYTSSNFFRWGGNKNIFFLFQRSNLYYLTSLVSNQPELNYFNWRIDYYYKIYTFTNDNNSKKKILKSQINFLSYYTNNNLFNNVNKLHFSNNITHVTNIKNNLPLPTLTKVFNVSKSQMG